MTKEKKPITIRLFKSQYDAVEKAAAEDDRNVSSFVRQAVTQHLEKRKKGAFRKLFSFIF